MVGGQQLLAGTQVRRKNCLWYHPLNPHLEKLAQVDTTDQEEYPLIETRDLTTHVLDYVHPCQLTRQSYPIVIASRKERYPLGPKK